MKRIILVLFTLTLSACAKDPDADLCGFIAPKTQDDARKDVLVIGDSISIGYYDDLGVLLPQAEVQHHDCNGKNSRHGMLNINDWLSVRPHWDIVVFNHGIWDNETESDHRTTDLEYETYIRYEARQIKARTTCPIFLLTTKTDRESNAGILHDNVIARRVMAEEGIPVLDTYSFSEGLERYDGTHYRPENEAKIAQFVNDGITQNCGAL